MGEIIGCAKFKIGKGKLDEFKRLSAKCMEIVRDKDTGTLEYKLYFNDDESECMVYERYKSSKALLEHFENLGDTANELMATGTVSGFVLGEPSSELGKALESGGVQVYSSYKSA